MQSAGSATDSQAEVQMVNDPHLNHEYLPIRGLAQFDDLAAGFLFGNNSSAVKEQRVATSQTVSGTDANHLGAKFFEHFYAFPGNHKAIYLSNPTWPNHTAIFNAASIEPKMYTYVRQRSCAMH